MLQTSTKWSMHVRRNDRKRNTAGGEDAEILYSVVEVEVVIVGSVSKKKLNKREGVRENWKK
jgi:hypothetical protein